jgi:magnesium-transporting ATPase (P-type)
VALWYSASRGADLITFRDGALAGIVVAIGILPEGLPVVMTVFRGATSSRSARRRLKRSVRRRCCASTTPGRSRETA